MNYRERDEKVFADLAMLGVAIASAKSYNVKLFQPATMGGVQLAPGEYRLDVVGSNVVLKSGKVEAQSPGREETVDAKYPSTTVRFDNAGGKCAFGRSSWAARIPSSC